ncbi:MAG: FAD-binding protein [Proteobacteria bacterium]|nr:FAD-binding protein [Pseudomonadota bacterium]
MKNFIEELRDLLGERLSSSKAVIKQHSHDESYHKHYPPDLVAFAESTGEVAEIVKICARYKKPVIPFGAGTSLEGHVMAVNGGVSLDLTKMNRVLKVNEDDLDCRVQAGVTHMQLNHHLKDTGLFFPVDPGADASIGGMTATRASGTNAVRYGTMRDVVMGLTVVNADGSIIETGSRARKSSAGYDLTGLYVGSEGTLGVITEINLRLFGVPEAISAAVCSFPNLEAAVKTVQPIIQLGIPVARIELMDEVQTKATNHFFGLELPEQATLLFEFHGTDNSVRENAETAGVIARENGGSDFKWAIKQDERNKLWKVRHNAFPAAKSLKPGCEGLSTDVCVPISRLTECILETQRELKEKKLIFPIVGHVGDGNFHVICLLDPTNEDEIRLVDEISSNLVNRALKMGGTCTGEHGVGFGKIKFMESEHGQALNVMRTLKKALDPLNILNPGKILPQKGNI